MYESPHCKFFFFFHFPWLLIMDNYVMSHHSQKIYLFFDRQKKFILKAPDKRWCTPCTLGYTRSTKKEAAPNPQWRHSCQRHAKSRSRLKAQPLHSYSTSPSKVYLIYFLFLKKIKLN